MLSGEGCVPAWRRDRRVAGRFGGSPVPSRLSSLAARRCAAVRSRVCAQGLLIELEETAAFATVYHSPSSHRHHPRPKRLTSHPPSHPSSLPHDAKPDLEELSHTFPPYPPTHRLPTSPVVLVSEPPSTTACDASSSAKCIIEPPPSTVRRHTHARGVASCTRCSLSFAAASPLS